MRKVLFKQAALLLGAAAIVAGCAQTEMEGENPDAGKGTTITAKASTKTEPETRLGYHEGATSMTFTWEKPDYEEEGFMVYTVSHAAVYDGFPFRQVSEAGTNEGTFEGEIYDELTEGDKFYAVYPILVYSRASNASLLRRPTELISQPLATTAEELKHSKLHYMWAEATYEGSNIVDFTFEHKVAIMKMEMTFPAGTGAITEVKLDGVHANGTIEVTTGNMIIDDTAPGATLTDTEGTGKALSADNKLTAYIFLLPEDVTGTNNLTLTAKDAANKSYEVKFDGRNIAAGKVYTKKVELKPVAPSITWAAGNLVADGANDCKIGAPEDGGLYFQFGSLIGWAGGASGDGTGVPASNNPGYPFNATGTVVPSGKSIPNAWGDPNKWTGGTTAAETVPAANDPCTHYLGSGWRLPTIDEYKTLFNNTTNSWADSGGWSWDNSSKSATHADGKKFPASGYRVGSAGGLNFVRTYGYYWDASPYDASEAYYLYFNSSRVDLSSGRDRATGLPVRCVQASN